MSCILPSSQDASWDICKWSMMEEEMVAKLGIPGLHIYDFSVSGGNASFYEQRAVTKFLHLNL